MGTLLIGTLERTAGWFNLGAFRRSIGADDNRAAAHAQAPRAVPLELRIRQWFCVAKGGHHFIRGIDRQRMYLICQDCFHETPGWELVARPPRNRD